MLTCLDNEKNSKTSVAVKSNNILKELVVYLLKFYPEPIIVEFFRID